MKKYSKELAQAIRKAQGEELKETPDQDMFDVIESFGDDPEEFDEFLEGMQQSSQARAKKYLAVIKASYEKLWSQVLCKAGINPDAKCADDVEPPPEKEEEKKADDTEPPPEKEEEEKKEAQEDEDEEEVIIEPVVTLDEGLPPETEMSMSLFKASTKDPYWVVFADGKPAAEIHLTDQENAESPELQEIFPTDTYSDSVIKACKSSVGPTNTLKALKAHWYASVMKKNVMHTQAHQAAAQKLEQEQITRLASLKEDFVNHANLAIVASLKGMLIENKLAKALVTQFRKAGVVNADAIVHEVFQKQGQEYMSNIIAQAEKWMGYNPEAMADLTKEILGAASDEGIGELPELEVPVQEEMQEKVTAGIVNVPIVTRKQTGNYREDTKLRLANAISRKRSVMIANKMLND